MYKQETQSTYGQNGRPYGQNGRQNGHLAENYLRIYLKKNFSEIISILIVSAFLAILAGLSVLGYFLLKKPDVNNPCSDGYHYLATSGFCYKTFLPISTRQDALNHCESEGGSLTSIHSLNENNFVRYLFNWTIEKYHAEFETLSENSQIWIGQEYDPYQEQYIWSDGSKVKYDNSKQTVATPNKPFLVVTPNGDGTWKSVNESTSASYTCKRPVGGFNGIKKECSPGFIFIKSTGFCYKTFIAHSTFVEASEQCADQASHLVSINSEEEHADVVKLYKNTLIEEYKENSNILLSSLWIGLTFNNNTWKWNDGSSLNWSNYRDLNWKSPGEGQFWTAIELYNSNPQKTIDNKWITVGQPNYFSFVCKKPDTSEESLVITKNDGTLETTTPIVEIDKSRKNCSKEYKYFKTTGSCYSFKLQPLNFTQAFESCRKENGHLASIHSEEEEQFLSDLAEEQLGTEKEIRTEFYIGLIYNNNRWEWTDGTPVNYADWNSMEPNFLLYEKWTSMTYRVSVDHKLSYGWNNMQSFQEGPYFCKKTAKV